MKYFAIILFAILIPLVCNAQVELNPNKTNIQTPPIVPCNPNTFWAVHYNPTGGFTTNISEFTLINSIITNNGIVATGCPGMSLAYANYNLLNGNGGTFYSIDYIQNQQLYMYNGVNWTPFGPASPGIHHAFAGYENKIYLSGYWNNTSNQKYIYSFDGTLFDTIFTTPTNFSLASSSITVDNNFNIWMILGPDPLNTPTTILLKIDTLGNLINQYPLSIQSQFAPITSGALFIMNNTLYIGFGPLQPNFPNTLMPFNIIGDSLVMGTPIPFSFPDVYDIKSCNQGTLTSISEVPESLKDLSVYPNPAQDQFMLHLPYRTSSNATIQIYNLQGEVVKSFKASDASPINCSSWPRGIYFVSLVEEGKARVTRKVVVI